MELHEALAQIDTIRLQLARTEIFRGYRAATVASSGASAMIAAGIQAARIPEPSANWTAYLHLWVSVAVVSIFVVACEVGWRWWHSSPAARQLTLRAVEQFLPCVLAGGAVTVMVAMAVPDCVALLPGVWSILFGLGVFASAPHLPGAVRWVAVWYLVCGVACVGLARDDQALSPWVMGTVFGIGQALAALVLYWNLERQHEVG